MKKVLLTLAVVFGGFIIAGAQEVVNGPVLSLDKEVHDYGTMDQGGDGNCVFTVTNDGTDPLIISRCKGSCGCTVPQCDKDPIMPGNKSVTITSNASNEPTKVIRIKGKIEAVAQQVGAPVKNAAGPTNKQ
jgi:hypothetical protein